jgi:hypothetical protein
VCSPPSVRRIWSGRLAPLSQEERDRKILSGVASRGILPFYAGRYLSLQGLRIALGRVAPSCHRRARGWRPRRRVSPPVTVRAETSSTRERSPRSSSSDPRRDVRGAGRDREVIREAARERHPARDERDRRDVAVHALVNLTALDSACSRDCEGIDTLPPPSKPDEAFR